MKANEVNPTDWYDKDYPIRVLFDKDNYSAIWGKYKGEKCLGVRWSGGSEHRGYPGQGNYPTWYIEPDFLILPILNKLLEIAINENNQDWKASILFAINEYSE